MLKTQPMLYSLEDITIVSSIVTDIKSRKECNPYRKGLEGQENFFPIIASPMENVVDEEKWSKYWECGISCIIPRTIPKGYTKESWLERRFELCCRVFCAFGLNEASWLLENSFDYCPSGSTLYFSEGGKIYVLIDIANGTMQEEIDLGKKLKRKFGDGIVLMGGNISNPETYLLYDSAGFDFLRCSVGTGSACLSSVQTGINYPMASLIDSISEIKYRYSGHTKIIADGGLRNFRDIIKCLALGADYAMLGGQLAKAAVLDGESVGDKVVFAGMSTKEMQRKMGNSNIKTSEGKVFEVTKEYTLSGWTENFDSYLRSAMSYCDARSLKEFREKAICQVISPNASSQINNK